ncbi:MAG: hypothetical protein IJ769_02145 [Clostridia bacterium]|nr:hypothetical protein [Clostridia bacterium]
MTTDDKLATLARIARRLNAANLTWGIGASLLLYFKGITDDFNDIDIMVAPQDAEALRRILCELGKLQPPNPKAQYRTERFYEFVIDGVDVDVMAGFAIVKDGVTYDCPFDAASVREYVEVNGERIPLQAVSDWRRYYALMGREAKVQMIDRWMAGADRAMSGAEGA